ncbi:MAG: hypothetical protein C0510_00635 [Erythrobacter sp.]|nr:hypothetical protein [Erythrobacter sp.]
MNRLHLPQVTLCAATSVNVAATVHALEASLAQIDFAACLLFTDAPVQAAHPAIRTVPVGRLQSTEAYSRFLLAELADHVDTSHCLVVQWDGHVLNPSRWDPAFLDHDFIGARWPQFGDGHDVGNGGFSLRSLRLLRACQSPRFCPAHPEDVKIGRTHRVWLEAQGLRFAPAALADRFSAERTGDPLASFGYHGVWHMPQVLGVKRFWQIYSSLDERGAIRHDLGTVLKQVAKGQGGVGRALHLLADRVVDAIKLG